MAIPDYQTLMLPVLRCASQGERRVSDLVPEIAAEFELTQDERDQLLQSGKQIRFNNRIQWAKFHLQKAGLIKSLSRGLFTATAEGRQLLARHPSRIDLPLLIEISATFRDFMQGIRNDQENGVAPLADVTGGEINLDVSITPEE